MNTLVLLSFLAVACLAQPQKIKYVNDEFIVRLDEQKIVADYQEIAMVATLRQQYGMELMRSHHIGKLKFLILNGTEMNIEAVSRLSGVKYVERNTIGHIDQCSEQPSPGTFGLDRIDQREGLPYSDPLSDAATYTYGENQGEGVTVYVVDTGIEIGHENFDNRAVWGYSDPALPEEADHPHGTHCAGTVGSRDYGVAKQPTLVAVKVVNSNGAGSVSQFVGGLEWVLADHLIRQESSGDQTKSVVSISLGYSPSEAIDDIVIELTDAGIVLVSSAGNDSGDACGQSPARSPTCLATGSTTVDDGSSWFSNYGPCVGVYAPGSNVLSTSLNGATEVMSGTSMAAPHAAGACARYMSSFDVAPSPAEVHEFIRASATVDAIMWFNDAHSVSDNLLLYSEC